MKKKKAQSQLKLVFCVFLIKKKKKLLSDFIEMKMKKQVKIEQQKEEKIPIFTDAKAVSSNMLPFSNQNPHTLSLYFLPSFILFLSLF